MIKDIALKLDFPQEAVNYLTDCYNMLRSYEGIDELLTSAQDLFFNKPEHTYLEILQHISDITKVNRYTVDMLFLLLNTDRVHNEFKKRKISDELFYELMSDLRFKLCECKNLYGVWGTFVTTWFKNGFLINRFKIGRLQYQTGTCPVDDYKGIVKKGEPIYYIHIPSSGPLDYNDVLKSLRQAYHFYSDSLKDGRLILFCESWLLYPPLFENYNEASNIKKFYNLFDIVKKIDDPKNSDFWRVFNVEYSPSALKNVVADNSLKRNVAYHLKNGGTMGEGIGVLIIDKDF